MADWVELQKSIGVTFNNPSLLHQAFVHCSFCNENPDAMLSSNERLEFLGDAFLGFVVAELLYKYSGDLNEGTMTKARSLVVDKNHLAALASSLNLGDYLYLGQGEQKSGGCSKPRNLASTLEAFVGALLIDQGSSASAEVVRRLLDDKIRKVVEEGILDDPKSKLQEVVQSRERKAPVYHTVSAKGPDHDKRFLIEVSVCGVVMGRGCGKSKREAEKAAAQHALEKLGKTDWCCCE